MEHPVIFDSGVVGEGDLAWRWLHLRRGPAAQAMLMELGDLSEATVWAMMEVRTQPRYVRLDGADLVILRGVNLNVGAEPEDMVSIRFCVTPGRLISVSHRDLQATQAMIARMREPTPPEGPGAFLSAYVEELRERAEQVTAELEQEVAAMELHAVQGGAQALETDRAQLNDARQDAIMLRRHLAPQAAALKRMGHTPPDWLINPTTMLEEGDAFQRLADDLDSLRGRAQVISDEITSALAERMNRIMMTLSVVSVVFLPLGFLTGLLGVNLAGIPFADRPWAFWGFSGLLVVAAGVALAALRGMWR